MQVCDAAPSQSGEESNEQGNDAAPEVKPQPRLESATCLMWPNCPNPPVSG